MVLSDKMLADMYCRMLTNDIVATIQDLERLTPKTSADKRELFIARVVLRSRGIKNVW